MTSPYDALLLLSFGGPEGPEDVMPFLLNVLRGRHRTTSTSVG
jgi:ferrochelatase